MSLKNGRAYQTQLLTVNAALGSRNVILAGTDLGGYIYTQRYMSAALGACRDHLLTSMSLKGLKWAAEGLFLKMCTWFFQLPKSVVDRQVRSSDRCSFLHHNYFRLRLSLWLLVMLTDICSQLRFKVVPSVEREQNVGPACLYFRRQILLLNFFLPCVC